MPSLSVGIGQGQVKGQKQKQGLGQKRKPALWTILLLVFVQFFSHAILWAQNEPVSWGEPAARVLLDYNTGRILFQERGHEILSLASLSKLVTMYLLLEHSQGEPEGLRNLWTVPEAADYRLAPPRSSLMFLESGQRVSSLDLLRGLGVSSGNEAALAVALKVSGSLDSFRQRMNRTFQEITGNSQAFFREPSGINPENRSSALAFAVFARHYIQQFPESLDLVHGLTEWTFPQSTHMVSGRSSLGPITQVNRNGLVGRYPGADGLKTGYIGESGYNLVATAERQGFRLIAVVLGVQGSSTAEGSRNRELAAEALLDWGFDQYAPYSNHVPEMGPLRLWSSIEGWVAVDSREVPRELVLSQQEMSGIHQRLLLPPSLEAPLAQGDILGYWELWNDQALLARYPLRAAESRERAPWYRIFWDQVKLFFSAILGNPLYPEPLDSLPLVEPGYLVSFPSNG